MTSQDGGAPAHMGQIKQDAPSNAPREQPDAAPLSREATAEAPRVGSNAAAHHMTPGSAAPPWQPQQQPPRPASASLPTQASTSQLRSLPTGSDSARDAAAQSAGGSGSGSGGSALPARPGASGSTNALHGKVFTQEHTQQLLQNAAQLIAAAQQLQKQRMIQGHSQPPHQPQQQQPIGHSAQPQFAGTMASQPGAATGIPMHQYHQQYQQQGYGGIKRKADAVLGQPAGDAVLGMPMDGGGPSSLAAAAPPPPPLQPAAAAALHHFASEDIGTSQAGPPAVLHQLDFAQYMEGGGFSAGEGDGDGEDGSGDSDAQGNKKARLVWTQELHNRFINALSHLGLKHAVPKNILTMMNVDGMTRENVASHLQKYRLYLKKIGGYAERDRVDPDLLQRLHEQNVQQMAAQQAVQHSMAAATGGSAYLGNQPYAAFGAYGPGGAAPPMEAAAAAPFPGGTAEGIPVSDAAAAGLTPLVQPQQQLAPPPPPPPRPYVGSATEAAAELHSNPEAWQYPQHAPVSEGVPVDEIPTSSEPEPPPPLAAYYQMQQQQQHQQEEGQEGAYGAHEEDEGEGQGAEMPPASMGFVTGRAVGLPHSALLPSRASSQWNNAVSEAGPARWQWQQQTPVNGITGPMGAAAGLPLRSPPPEPSLPMLDGTEDEATDADGLPLVGECGPGGGGGGHMTGLPESPLLFF